MIHYVCVATENKLYLPYLKQLLPDLVILGMDMEWKGFKMKFELTIDYLKTLNDDDIVCFIDGYDVLPTKKIFKLEKRFNKFTKKNPDAKIIIGSDTQDFFLTNILSNILFGKVNNYDRLNSGQYIGYVKNIKYILNNILNKDTIKDDQIELTNYANNNPNEIHIDVKKRFFNVKTTPLMQVNSNNKSCFLHANGNGYLEDFLLEEHNILVPKNIRIANYITNINAYCNKLKMYSGYLYNDLINSIYSAILGIFQSFNNPPSYKLNIPEFILSSKVSPIISNLV
jgi:hypothetical protein